jgi:uncharacterized protein YxeA
MSKIIKFLLIFFIVSILGSTTVGYAEISNSRNFIAKEEKSTESEKSSDSEEEYSPQLWDYNYGGEDNSGEAEAAEMESNADKKSDPEDSGTGGVDYY